MRQPCTNTPVHYGQTVTTLPAWKARRRRGRSCPQQAGGGAGGFPAAPCSRVIENKHSSRGRSMTYADCEQRRRRADDGAPGFRQGIRSQLKKRLGSNLLTGS